MASDYTSEPAPEPPDLDKASQPPTNAPREEHIRLLAQEIADWSAELNQRLS